VVSAGVTRACISPNGSIIVDLEISLMDAKIRHQMTFMTQEQAFDELDFLAVESGTREKTQGNIIFARMPMKFIHRCMKVLNH